MSSAANPIAWGVILSITPRARNPARKNCLQRKL